MITLRASAFLTAVPLLVTALLWSPPEPPLVNVAPLVNGTRITADTQYGDHVGAPNVADGRMDNGYACWFSKDWTTLPCALTFEFAQPEKLRRAALYQAIWGGSMYHTKDFAIEVSADGSTWRRVTTGSLPDQNGARVELPVVAETRWLRVVVLTSYIPFQTCGFAEIELYAERPVSIGEAELRLNGKPATVSRGAAGTCFAFGERGAQALVDGFSNSVLLELGKGDEAELTVPVTVRDGPAVVALRHEHIGAPNAEVSLDAGRDRVSAPPQSPAGAGPLLECPVLPGSSQAATIRVKALDRAVVRLFDVRVAAPGRLFPVRLDLRETDYGAGAPPETPSLRPAIERALIEADWRAQDGIGTPCMARDIPAAIREVRERGDRLAAGLDRGSLLAYQWRSASDEARKSNGAPSEGSLRTYLALRSLKREMLLTVAGDKLGPILFAKQVPGCFSHQLTQYYGRYARPGGGIFVLERPGKSMQARSLTAGRLPQGSFMLPDVSWDADRILFAFCEADTTPADTIQGHKGRYYHLYGCRPDGTGLRRLTAGSHDDFAPRFLPDGRMVFVSTRRGGWHRCGTPGCENYVLTTANADGTGIRPISFHETQEWDPAVMNDGRLVYTRWDYVDRHPVFYEHLWTTAPDGARAAALFGNNTFNPVGIWEARPIPGSRRLMATAAAHHAMTAGSIILVDPARGVDGSAPITRLTPDVPFPESETPVAPSWYAPTEGVEPRESDQNRRWPGHCYRSPYPLSERMFLAAYSFDRLIGEPKGNAAAMFGIYLCDADGNKELLYRDPAISSLWPIPLRARRRPPVVPSNLDARLGQEGVFVLQDVYASLPRVPRGTVKALRIVQVLPKSTPGKDLPPVGIPSGAPGKQVLGTVPVEPDGSAHFSAPARKELAFQALDERGMAVQVMRSGTYLQPGERTTCVGCHEPRVTAPRKTLSVAQRRPPSRIVPGPDGSKPLSYPILVQGVLDKRCGGCHTRPTPAGGVLLSGKPDGHYTASYNALAPRVPFSDMGNGEPLSKPDRYGARGSPLMKKLLDGHQGVRLSKGDIERLATWMDVSVLFYGTFDPADQARQQAGLRIKGPKIE